MFGLDWEIDIRGRSTTIRNELTGSNCQLFMLFKYDDDSTAEKYQVVSSKVPGDTSDTRAFEISKADFVYLRECGVRDAF